MKVTISKAGANDHDFIVNAQIEMALETEGLHLDRETVKLGVGAVLLDPGKGSYYLVRGPDDEPIACVLTLPEWSDWRNGAVLWIHSLYVKPEFRGQGVFSSLYAFLKELVSTHPALMGLRLYVDRRNERAQGAYQKLGMRRDHYELYEWMKTF